jgi:hypothetical protein
VAHIWCYFPFSGIGPVSYGIPQVCSTFFGSGFRFLVSFFWFQYIMTSNPSPVIATMVDIEELDEDLSPEGALAYLVEFVFPKETDILLSFFEYNGIEDFDDFISSNEENLNQPYSTLSTPDTILSLSPALIKNLLSVQSWYGYMLQDDDNDPITIVFSLTTTILSNWQRNQVVQRFSTNSSSLPTYSPTLPTITPVASLPQTSPSIRSVIKVNISDYPKLKDKNQWRNFHR